MDISAIAEGLKQGPDGIWVSRGLSEISYPEEGNVNCLALEADSFWFEHRNRAIAAVIRRFAPPGTIFDVGGGNGYVAMGLQQAGIPVALVEPGWQGVQNARLRGVETLIYSTLEDAGFRTGSLPAVSLFDVLEHIEDDLPFLRKVQELLVPAGRLYLTVPAFQALWSSDDQYAGHFRRYTLADLRRLLKKAGFELEFASYIFFMLPFPIFLMRTIPTRLGFQRQDDWDRYEQEHQRKPGVVGYFLNLLLNWELKRLRQGHAVPVGGSCLVAARKSQSSGWSSLGDG